MLSRSQILKLEVSSLFGFQDNKLSIRFHISRYWYFNQLNINSISEMLKAFSLNLRLPNVAENERIIVFVQRYVSALMDVQLKLLFAF
jgi:hypothetical protein